MNKTTHLLIAELHHVAHHCYCSKDLERDYAICVQWKRNGFLTGNMSMVPGGPGIPSAPGRPGRPSGPLKIEEKRHFSLSYSLSLYLWLSTGILYTVYVLLYRGCVLSICTSLLYYYKNVIHFTSSNTSILSISSTVSPLRACVKASRANINCSTPSIRDSNKPVHGKM